MNQTKLNTQENSKNLEKEADIVTQVETAPDNRSTQAKPKTPNICPACLAKMEKYAMGSLETNDIYSCQSCGSVFLAPPITREDIDNFYSELDIEVIHASNHEKRIKQLEKIISKLVVKPEGKTFLNIDCIQGYAVEAVKYLRFKEAKGIDRYEFFTDFAQKNYGDEYFETCSVEDYAAKGGTATVVVAIESFCKEPDMEKHMQAIAKIVKPGGMLYIEEVDGNSHFLPNDLTRWTYMQPPITVNFISEKAMRAMLERNGFKVRKKFFNWGVMMKLVAIKVK